MAIGGTDLQVQRMRGAVGVASLLVLIGSAPTTGLSQECSTVGFLVSAVGVAGLAVFDIATAPASARRYNRRHVAVLPHVDLRHHSYGLSVALPLGRSAPALVSSPPNRKSPGTAFVLSLTSTAVPMLGGAAMRSEAGGGVLVAGMVVGPSVGHFYAGQTVRGLVTTGLRGVGTAAGFISIINCFK